MKSQARSGNAIPMKLNQQKSCWMKRSQIQELIKKLTLLNLFQFMMSLDLLPLPFVCQKSFANGVEKSESFLWIQPVSEEI
jgi:hypothetical protein